MNDLSHLIRRAAARWLFAEVRVDYVGEEVGLPARQADVVGLKLERVERRTKYRKERREFDGRSYLATVSAGTTERTLPPAAYVIEVKISRADFLAGVRKGQLANAGAGLGAYADFAYVAAPAALVRVDELPSGWGLVEFDAARPPQMCMAVALKAKRLAPAHPLTANLSALSHTLAQSAMWRLYRYGTAITYSTYAVPRGGYRHEERTIVLADEAAS